MVSVYFLHCLINLQRWTNSVCILHCLTEEWPKAKINVKNVKRFSLEKQVYIDTINWYIKNWSHFNVKFARNIWKKRRLNSSCQVNSRKSERFWVQRLRNIFCSFVCFKSSRKHCSCQTETIWVSSMPEQFWHKIIFNDAY